jgi:hypothetical protein
VTKLELECALDGLIALAGDVALRYARTRRYVARYEETALHESGHAVIALSCGRFVHWLSIIPAPHVVSESGLKYLLGLCAHSPTAGLRIPEVRSLPKTDAEGVIQTAVLLVELGIDDENANWRAWLRAIRTLRSLTRRLVELNYPFIDSLSHELVSKQSMEEGEINAWLRGFASKIVPIHPVELAAALDPICGKGKQNELRAVQEVA